MAIAVFGLMLARTFDTRVRRALDRLSLSRRLRRWWTGSCREAGRARDRWQLSPASQRRAARDAIDRAFVSAFRLILSVAALLALAAAATGAILR